MRVEIGKLTECEESQSNVQQQGVRLRSSGRGWRVGWVCDQQASQNPVVKRVLENVACRHCRIAEAVHEQCLELSFEEMQCDRDAGRRL